MEFDYISLRSAFLYFFGILFVSVMGRFDVLFLIYLPVILIIILVFYFIPSKKDPKKVNYTKKRRIRGEGGKSLKPQTSDYVENIEDSVKKFSEPVISQGAIKKNSKETKITGINEMQEFSQKEKEKIFLEVEQLKKYVVLNDNESIEKIYESNLELVNQIARKYIRFINSGLSFQDLIKAGSTGLRDALERYDSSVHEFSIFAYLYIRQYIVRFITIKRTDNPTNIPKNVQLRGKESRSKKASEVEGPDTITYKFQKQRKSISEADELKKYFDLKDQGIITEEEFQAKKKKLLDL